MKLSRTAAAVAAVAAVFATAGPATAATPANWHIDRTPAAAPHTATAAAAGNRTSTAGSLSGYADSYGLFQWGGPNNLTAITMQLKPSNSRCDGPKIGIRLVTVPYHGSTHYWPWHGYTTRCGREFTYNTYANDSNGIHYATVEIGLFNGSTLVGTQDARLSERPSA
ncbi:hypothetical protein ACWC4D_36240 [Streptomyces sp. NPDC001288]|uniref:hypothetical protein n=1 Tax=unclassified Streptomyces TaxID=2593676 RepID=UPI00332BFE12